MLNLDLIRSAPVATTPFPYFLVENVLDHEHLTQVSRDFPDIRQPGVFPLSDLRFGQAFEALVEAIRSSDLEALIAEKFGLDLAGHPLMMTVRGHCQKKDGRIHADSKDKIVTCLLYLNAPDWAPEGGRLRLLRNRNEMDSTIVEVPPTGGTLVAFRRTDISWHGHQPYEGQRRYIMFNWVQSDMVLAKNLGRHKLSAMLKRIGLSYGY